MWLWASDPAAGPAEVTVLWQAFLRRFDLEHTFRFLNACALHCGSVPSRFLE
jgi:hypothetical protein